jgi:16S rRNA (uracil1498-N3)-methyltransferase
MSPRPLHRFHYPDRLQGGEGATVALSEAEAHHLRDVLRLGVGSRIEIFDSTGQAWEAEIAAVQGSEVTARLLQPFQSPSQPIRRVTIASALLKRRATDWLIEKISELGVASYQPLLARRCVGEVDPEAATPARWERLALAAAKQCGRNRPLEILPVQKLEAWLTGLGQAPLAVACACAHGQPIGRWLAQTLSSAPETPLTVAIGPEGGWAPEEVTAMEAAGLAPVNLGVTTLRAETAAVAAAALCLLYDA